MICAMFTKVLVIAIQIQKKEDPEKKILIVFDDMIADMIHNKKLDSIVIELFIRGRNFSCFYHAIKL